MRRRYAFEAEGVSDEVKAQLEIAEDAVEDNCETVEDCDKMLDKIDSQAEKFDAALKSMSDSAKDCKDGKCSASDMAQKITPAMAELKEVAQTIGVAKEGDEGAVTEDELKDVKDYLEGAKEIVEAKKDELEGGEGGEPEKGNLNDSEKEALENWLDYGLECFMDELDDAADVSIVSYAMEGATIDAVAETHKAMSAIRSVKKEMNAAKKAHKWKEAAAKARQISKMGDMLANNIAKIPDSVGSAVLVNLALALVAILAAAGIGIVASGAIKEKRGLTKANAEAADTLGKQIGEEHKIQHLRNSAKELNQANDDLKNLHMPEEKVKQLELFNNMGPVDDNMKRTHLTKARDKLLREAPEVQKKAAEIGENAAKNATEDMKKNLFRAEKLQVQRRTGTAAAGGTALTAAGLNLQKILRGKKVIDADGNVTRTKIGANDVNAIIVAMKAAAKSIKEKYTKLAEEFEAKAKTDYRAGSESNLVSAADNLIAACENYMISGGSNRTSGAFPFFM